MKISHHAGLLAVIASSLMVATTIEPAMGSEDYSFKVSNTTSDKIKAIQVSENGRKWGYFDIGSGISPGATVTLVWDKSTNDENCTQYFKAIFADGSESESVKFDFCEDDLELEF
jgi:hypothetical protein